jgi:hypothetical protein
MFVWVWSDKNRINSARVLQKAVTPMTRTLIMPMLKKARISFEEMERIRIIAS